MIIALAFQRSLQSPFRTQAVFRMLGFRRFAESHCRHGRAAQQGVGVRRRPELIRGDVPRPELLHAVIVVEDDGVGFDLAAARERMLQSGHFGIFNMRERIQELGGAIANSGAYNMVFTANDAVVATVIQVTSIRASVGQFTLLFVFPSPSR